MKTAILAGILALTQLSAYEIVDFKEVQESGDLSVEKIAELSKDVVIRFEKGSYIPLTFSLEGDFFSLEGESSYALKAKKTLYLKGNFLEGEFFFSQDLESWGEFEKFFTGNLSVGNKMLEEGMGLSIDLELNKR